MKSSNFLSMIVFVGFVLFVSCTEEDPAPNLPDRGTIIGRDYGLCVCCGGWFIDINDERYRFIQVPSETEIDLIYGEFPMEVFVRWSQHQDVCFGNEIEVTSIELIN